MRYIKYSFLSAMCLFLVTAAACQLTDYLATGYQKDEVMSVYENNRDLFIDAVRIVSTNEEFLFDGPRFDGMHPFIDTPTGREIGYFEGEDKERLCELFELGPYQILYEDEYVSIIFLGTDGADYYTFSYIIGDSQEGDLAESLRQERTVEELEDCIFYY